MTIKDRLWILTGIGIAVAAVAILIYGLDIDRVRANVTGYSLTVAACDGSHNSKTRAMYVSTCTGDDWAMLQNAVDNHGVVTLSEGTFHLSQAINLSGNNALHGQGFSTILRLNDWANDRVITTPLGRIYNIELKHFQIDGNRDNQMDHPIEGEQSAINIDQVTNAVIDGLYVHSSSSNGLYAANSSTNIDVLNSRWERNGKQLNGRGIVFGISPKDFRIVNNYIAYNTKQGISIQSEGGDHAHRWLIQGNIVHGNGGVGIDVGDNIVSQVTRVGGIEIAYGTISHNIINNNAQGGIRVFSVAEANAFGAKVFIHSIAITQNTITANGPYGIYLLQLHQSRLQQIAIANNQIGRQPAGIWIQGNIPGRWIHDNYFSDTKEEVTIN